MPISIGDCIYLDVSSDESRMAVLYLIKFLCTLKNISDENLTATYI